MVRSSGFWAEIAIGAAEEDAVEDPDLESGEELEEEDFSSDVDPMLKAEVGPGEAEGVLEEDEA